MLYFRDDILSSVEILVFSLKFPSFLTFSRVSLCSQAGLTCSSSPVSQCCRNNHGPSIVSWVICKDDLDLLRLLKTLLDIVLFCWGLSPGTSIEWAGTLPLSHTADPGDHFWLFKNIEPNVSIMVPISPSPPYEQSHSWGLDGWNWNVSKPGVNLAIFPLCPEGFQAIHTE